MVLHTLPLRLPLILLELPLLLLKVLWVAVGVVLGATPVALRDAAGSASRHLQLSHVQLSAAKRFPRAPAPARAVM